MMNALLKIRCRDLGVDHPGFVSGTSLDDLINCVKQRLREDAGMSLEKVSSQQVRDLVRSALLQTCRPSATRSVSLSQLVA